MKKFLAIFLAVTMLLGILSGCGDTGDTSSVASEGGEQVQKEPFVLATSITNLVEGGDFASEKSPFRCVDNISVYNGSSRGAGDKYCLRATGTSYCIMKKSNVEGGKYILRFWLKDNGAADSVEMNVYVNAQVQQTFTGMGNNKWTEYVSDIIEVPESATVSVRLDVMADNAKNPVVVDFDEASFEKIPYDYPDVYTGSNPVSYLEKVDSQTNVFNIGGERVILKTAFADDLNVSAFKENGYNAFTYTFNAGDDLSKIENAVKVAEDNDLYMQIFYNLKGEDENNKADLEADKAAIEVLMKKLSERDTGKKVISINISNKFVTKRYAGVGYSDIPAVTYLDALAKIVKTSGHAMITSVSQQGNEMPHFIYNTEYIDYNCSELSTADAIVASQAINDKLSRIGAIAKTTATTNLTSLMMKSYAKNGYMATSSLIANSDIKSINEKVANIESLLVNSPSENKASFNTKGMIQKEYVGREKIGEVIIKFEAYVDNGPVGIAVYKDKAAYCIADKMSFFSAYGVDAVGVAGEFDAEGNFAESETKLEVQDALDGSYRCDYSGQKVIKFTYYIPTDIELTSVALEPNYDIKYLDPIDAPIGVNLIPGNGSFEDGVQPFEWQKVSQRGEANYITKNTSNQAIGKASINFYCSGDNRNIYGKIDLGVLPKGTYGIMAKSFGGKIKTGAGTDPKADGYNPDQYRIEIVANKETICKMQMNGNGSGWKQYIDTFELKSKAKVSFEVIVALDRGGMWAFLDGLECVRIG